MECNITTCSAPPTTLIFSYASPNSCYSTLHAFAHPSVLQPPPKYGQMVLICRELVPYLVSALPLLVPLEVDPLPPLTCLGGCDWLPGRQTIKKNKPPTQSHDKRVTLESKDGSDPMIQASIHYPMNHYMGTVCNVHGCGLYGYKWSLLLSLTDAIQVYS